MTPMALVAPARPLRVLFAVQGEGRGHMTQALALRDLLAARGHTVCGVLVGRSEGRKVPDFFADGIGAPTFLYDSPNFAYDGHAVSLSRTVRVALRRSWIYAHHLQLIHRRVTALQPDVIVNFYEGLVGLYSLAFRPSVPVVCIGHQYMFHHPDYRFAPGQRVGRAALRTYTQLTAIRAQRRLALSFYPANDVASRSIRVVPPLLRREVLALDGSRSEDFFLVYLLNTGMAEQVEAWHARRRDVRLECFWDRERYQPHANLTFHPLCGERFLQLMARARGVVCTAGFESVSEALWLGKPAHMVPTPGHLEQRTNALDAVRTGAGLHGRRFDLDDFIHYLHARPPGERRAAQQRFRAWVRAGEARFVEEIEAAAGGRPSAASSVRLKSPRSAA
jgi:uncharacterized protein (TIGR00661 family)